MSPQQNLFDVIAQEKALVKVLAGLSDESELAFNDVGWDSRVYVVANGQYVFKFPRSSAAKTQYQTEIAACKIAHRLNLDVQIPHVSWEHPDNDYVGFRGVVGTTLDGVIAQLNAKAHAEIGKAIGAFLKRFHQCDLAGASAKSIEDEIRQMSHQYELGLPVTQQCLTEAEQFKLHRLITEALPLALRSLGEGIVLCHGDLGYWNIIYREDGGVGIIDFGDVGYYDKSRDFIGLDDQAVLEAALHAYGDDAILRQKIALRQQILPILELPHYLGQRDQMAIEKTLLKIKVNLAY